MKNKTTIGFVTQFYDDEGKCTSQEFVAGDQVDWEDEDGETCDVPEHEYHTFDMVQPDHVPLDSLLLHLEKLRKHLTELRGQLATYEAEDYNRQQEPT